MLRLKYLKNSKLNTLVKAFLVLIVLSSCETENTRTLTLNESFLNLKPSSSDLRFANALGDTIAISLISNLASTETLLEDQKLGSLGAVDVLKAERRSYIVHCDTPLFNFNYQFFIKTNGIDKRSYSDHLLLSMDDSSGTLSDNLELIYRNDSLYLGEDLGFYQDSLTLISKSFTEVVGPLVKDASEAKMFYFTLSKGLVGFRLGSGDLYELLD
jgi:hypothetical protein